MDQKSEFHDEDVSKLLRELTDEPARDSQAQHNGRDRFLAQAASFRSAVSAGEELRHTNRKTQNFLERILVPMKLNSKFSALAGVFLLAVIGLVLATRVTTVSANQILERAAAARIAPTAGILHTRLQIFENHAALVGNSEGATTINEDYYDLATGKIRQVTTDPAGQLLDASASDGAYNYTTDSSAGSDPITVLRQPYSADDLAKFDSGKAVAYYDPEASANELFESFRNNPRVRVDDQKTWTDGRKVYVLIDDNYQSQAGSDQTSLIGSVRMVFDADSYELVESQTTVRKDGQDVVIDEVQWLVNEVLPAGSPVAWDLSDLPGIQIVDAPANETVDDVSFETLTREQLAAHTSDFYTLQPVPSAYTEEIVAVADQPADQPYTFEIHYIAADGADFNLQAVGQMDAGFVESSFYDGSYKSANGLTIYYSTSNPKGVSAMLVAPNGESFLLWSNQSREQVQTLVDTLVKGQ